MRSLRWWDHLTTWQTRELDGITGRVTVPFTGARERMRDVQAVHHGASNQPLSMLTQHMNPGRSHRHQSSCVEALSVLDDPTGEYLFRVWPIASTGTVYARVRADPGNVFTDAGVVVPFDASVLINGTCMKYAIGDATNPGMAMEFDRAYNERVSS